MFSSTLIECASGVKLLSNRAYYINSLPCYPIHYEYYKTRNLNGHGYKSGVSGNENYFYDKKVLGGGHTRHTPAPASAVAAAPFQA